MEFFIMAVPRPPINIESNKIKELRDWINQYLNAEDTNGELDLNRAQRNINYCAGDFYTNLNGIYMQEEFKLRQLESDLSKIKAIQYDKIKRFTDYVVESAGIKILLDGNEEVRKKQLELDKQEAYLDFLDRSLKQFSFYSNKVEIMLKAREAQERYG
jgi:hypothetical protein